MKKNASSQASWALLAEGVADARVQTHVLRTFQQQLKEAIDSADGELREEIYALCGDNLLSIPQTLSKIERALDRTNYALIMMGKDFYRQRIPHSDRELVDMASKYNPTPHGISTRKVALRYVKQKG